MKRLVSTWRCNLFETQFEEGLDMRFKTGGSAQKTSQIGEGRRLFLGVTLNEPAGPSETIFRRAAEPPALNRAASVVG